MSDLAYAIAVQNAQLKEKTHGNLMSTAIRVARECDYTDVGVVWYGDGGHKGLSLQTQCVFVDTEKETMALCAHQVFHVTDVIGLSFFTPGASKKANLMVKWEETTDGELRLKLNEVVHLPLSKPTGDAVDQKGPLVQTESTDKPTLEEAKLVSFEFSKWIAGGADAQNMCSVSIHGKERISCVAPSKEEAYQLAFQRSVELMKK